MDYAKLTPADITFFKEVLPENRILTTAEDKWIYGKDYTEDLHFEPEVVLMPETTEEVVQIVRHCAEKSLPITTRGAGTGLSGGALPVCGGVVLAMEKMNRILGIDEENFQVKLQPGVVNQHLRDAVEAKGLFYPPDPASMGSSMIGGNIAENAGGPRAVKYGVTKDYVLNLKVVLASGEVIQTGADVLKFSTGYHLTDLMVGSEGTLGIITEITLKLIPFPKERKLFFAPFASAEKACKAVAEICRAGIDPSALELMENAALAWSMKYADIALKLPMNFEAYLLIELDGDDEEAIFARAERMNEVLEKMGAAEVIFADTPDEQAKLWKARRAAGEAVHSHSIYKEEDTVVPRAKLPDLLKKVKTIGKNYGFQSVCYGHAGDGNLHVNILKADLSDEFWQNNIKLAIREIFEAVVEMGGTLSGEHGIGWVQKEFMDIPYPPHHLALLKNIKLAFDPKLLLNPMKIIPDEKGQFAQ